MSDEVTIHEAKTQFSKLVRRAEAGEEIVVRRGRTPVAKIVRYEEPPRKRRLGQLKGQIWMADDFDELPEGFEDYV
jgi:prevent-host-death family protein